MIKNENKVTMGRQSRAAGKRFEARVRIDMEEKGWIIDKWSNNVIFEGNGMLVPAKPKYNPFTKQLMMIVGGFPDFIAFRWKCQLSMPKGFDMENATVDEIKKNIIDRFEGYDIIGVESKMNGKLDAIEKEKCKWLLENNIFSKILIASKGEKRGVIKYDKFQ